MALFSKKQETVKEKKKVVKAVKVTAKKDAKKPKTSTKTPTPVVSKKDVSWVLVKPRITEKSTITPEKVNAYVFEINKDATSIDVKAAIYAVYKVAPVKVNITKIPTKEVSRQRRGASKKGFKQGGKKAYVYLKKGDKIEFV
jgi:large subunit ribosomal protein L23